MYTVREIFLTPKIPTELARLLARLRAYVMNQHNNNLAVIGCELFLGGTLLSAGLAVMATFFVSNWGNLGVVVTVVAACAILAGVAWLIGAS